jgi:hypothetical protein
MSHKSSIISKLRAEKRIENNKFGSSLFQFFNNSLFSLYLSFDFNLYLFIKKIINKSREKEREYEIKRKIERKDSCKEIKNEMIKFENKLYQKMSASY